MYWEGASKGESGHPFSRCPPSCYYANYAPFHDVILSRDQLEVQTTTFDQLPFLIRWNQTETVYKEGGHGATTLLTTSRKFVIRLALNVSVLRKAFLTLPPRRPCCPRPRPRGALAAPRLSWTRDSCSSGCPAVRRRPIGRSPWQRTPGGGMRP
jgi:hypothetical protein